MKNNLKSFSKIAAFVFLLSTLSVVKSQTVELSPLYHTIGVKVTNINNYDSCRVEYKQAQASDWFIAYPPDRITVNGVLQFRGSIFGLGENNLYDVKVTLYTNSNPTTLLTYQTTTLFSPDFSPTANTKWVSPDGSGNAYTQQNPGNVSTLFSSGQVTCGTTVIFADGTYTIPFHGLQLIINNNCAESTPIILMAAPGAKPIINGGVAITTPWIQDPNDAKLYSNTLPANTGHTNICVLDTSMLYPYPTVDASLLYSNLRDLTYGYDGFVRNDNNIWIKTQSGINPNTKMVIVSKNKRFLTVYGNNKNVYLKVKGIEFKYFGRPSLNPIGSQQDSYAAMVFDLRNVNHIYFDSCVFKYNTSDLSFNGTFNHILVENTSFKHDAGKWSHAMIKKSHDVNALVSSTRGRAVETAAIFLEQGKYAVMRNNYFDGLNSGVESFVDIGLKEEVDIYNNIFTDNYDAIECDGLWSNLRVWHNEIIRPMAAVSAAPPLIGPRFFYRNLIHGMQGRRNDATDPSFVECAPVNGNFKSQGIGIKTNPNYTGSIPKGNLYFFNNTFHAADSLGYVFTSWESEWKEAIFINNSYTHQIRHPFFYANLANNVNKNFQIKSINDNYYSFNINSPIVKVKHIHGQYICTDIYNAFDIQNTLTDISGSTDISIQNPLQLNPGFTTYQTEGFELSHSSPLIDAGILIPGFYDYSGLKPDIGAKESDFTMSTNNADTNSNGVYIYPNPSSGLLTIKTDNPHKILSVSVFNLIGQKVYAGENFSVQEITIDLKDSSDGFYFALIKTENAEMIKKISKSNK